MTLLNAQDAESRPEAAVRRSGENGAGAVQYDSKDTDRKARHTTTRSQGRRWKARRLSSVPATVRSRSTQSGSVRR